MRKTIKKTLASLGAFTILFSNCLPVMADTKLPEGAVKGLPEKLSVMDDEGQIVSESGEYFFHVENMTPFETYSKKVQIMNLRQDKGYHIYFKAEPLYSKGEIDLENDCEAVIKVNGNEVFDGRVNGESLDGKTNISETPVDLGYYAPGATGQFECEVTWNGIGSGGFIDNGARLIDKDGIHILREESGDHYIYGETEFKWIFYAAVDETTPPPNTGLLAQSSEMSDADYFIILFIMLITIAMLIVLNKKKARKKKCR